MKDDDIRIKFSRVFRQGDVSPCYRIYYQDRYQGEVYAAKDIESFIDAIPTNA